MESDRSTGSMYRLVVNLPGRDVVYDAPPFRTRKRAVARVAAAVRGHAGEGTITAVTLEGAVREATVADRSPSPTNGDGHWRTLERWEGVVIRRILEQRRGPGPSPSVPGGPCARPLEPSSVCCAAAPETVHPLPGGPAMAQHAMVTVAEPTGAAPVGWTQASAADADPAPASAVGDGRGTGLQPSTSRGRRVPDATRKGHRWHTAAMLVLAGLVWVALAVLLAGGHLSSLFTDAGLPRSQMVSDLPFEAPAATEPHDASALFGSSTP